MGVRVIDNQTQPLGPILSDTLQKSNSASIASAFLNSSGLQFVDEPLNRILETGGNVRLVHGADLHITDAGAMKRLAALQMNHGSAMSYGVFFDEEFLASGRFHSKLYLMSNSIGKSYAIVGSSNLTNAGLEKNTECNCIIDDRTSSPLIQACFESFRRIENDDALIKPDGEWIAKYERAVHLTRERSPKVSNDLQALFVELRQPTQAANWQVATQVECVIRALQLLSSNATDGFFSLREIEAEAWRVAVAAGLQFVRANWPHSIRKVLNRNTLGKDGLKVFERQYGEESKSGRYRLTSKGRTYTHRK